MEGITNFMSVFNILIGVLCLYSAIRGKGMVYKNEYPKQVAEPYEKMLRKLLWIIGPLALFDGASDYFKFFSPEVIRITSLVICGVIFALIVAFIIWVRVKFGKIIDRQFKGFR